MSVVNVKAKLVLKFYLAVFQPYTHPLNKLLYYVGCAHGNVLK